MFSRKYNGLLLQKNLSVLSQFENSLSIRNFTIGQAKVKQARFQINLEKRKVHWKYRAKESLIS